MPGPIRNAATRIAQEVAESSNAIENAARWLAFFLQEATEKLADFEEDGVVIEARVLIKPAPKTPVEGEKDDV